MVNNIINKMFFNFYNKDKQLNIIDKHINKFIEYQRTSRYYDNIGDLRSSFYYSGLSYDELSFVILFSDKINYNYKEKLLIK